MAVAISSGRKMSDQNFMLNWVSYFLSILFFIFFIFQTYISLFLLIYFFFVFLEKYSCSYLVYFVSWFRNFVSCFVCIYKEKSRGGWEILYKRFYNVFLFMVILFDAFIEFAEYFMVFFFFWLCVCVCLCVVLLFVKVRVISLEHDGRTYYNIIVC